MTPAGNEEPRSMLWFAADPPNLVSLAGLVAAVVGIYFAVLGMLPATMIALAWAIALDWLDGRVARAMDGRTDQQRVYGAQLDSLIDVVSFGVLPAVVLLSLGHYSGWYVPGAVVVFAAAVIRLAYFNVFGLAGGTTYRGLSLDSNALVLIALFAARPLVAVAAFPLVVYAALVALAALNLSAVRTPKLGGNWFYAVVAYALCASAWFGWQLFALR